MVLPRADVVSFQFIKPPICERTSETDRRDEECAIQRAGEEERIIERDALVV